MAEEFADGAGSVRPRTLVDALRRYVEQARRDGVDVLVTDAMIPFVPSLVAWGHDEAAIAAVIEEVAEAVAPTEVTVAHLRGDPAIALRRAIDREVRSGATGTCRSSARHPGSSSSTTFRRRWNILVGKRT